MRDWLYGGQNSARLATAAVIEQRDILMHAGLFTTALSLGLVCLAKPAAPPETSTENSRIRRIFLVAILAAVVHC